MSRARTLRCPISYELKYTYRLELVAGIGAGDAHVPQSWVGDRAGRCDAWARSCRAIPSRRRQSLGGLHWRYLPSDHLCRSHIVNRYGR